MKKVKSVYCLIALLILGFVTRFYLLGYLPGGVNFDEAMGAVDAYALSKYGTDRFGTRLPLHFNAWGYGQMSVFMGYLQAFCIGLFGFSTTSVRLPIAILSVAGMIAVYMLCRRFVSEKIALLALFLAIICPWHLIQSRWALDCNAFPHVFLIGLTLLLYGVSSPRAPKVWLIYGSMIFFGLTFYCYGIAVYSVPVFLVLFAIYLFTTQKISLKDLVISIMIFLLIASGEILVMIVNYFELDTITTPLFTMERFYESVRSNDILFLNFSFGQLVENGKHMLSVLFIQPPEAGWNNVAKYGSVYPVSGIFGVLGVLYTIIKWRKKEPVFSTAILLYLFTAIWIGLTTKEVNVNRLNLIFYPWIIFVSFGIYSLKDICAFLVKKCPNNKIKENIGVKKIGNYLCISVILGYLILGAAFFRLYFVKYEAKYGDICFNKSYMSAIEYADSLTDYDSIYITAYTGYGANTACSEILMNYALKLDPLYFQGKVNTSHNKVLPYEERYHFFYSWDSNEDTLAGVEQENGYNTCFLVHRQELEYIDMDYILVGEINDFIVIAPAY